MQTLEVVYVLEKIGLSGGIKNVIEQANRLYAAGVKVQIFALSGEEKLFSLRVPIRQFHSYPSMLKELATMNAIKIATWWKTLPIVLSSCSPPHGGLGVPMYLVQDIEESYYPLRQEVQEQVLDTYRTPVRMLTIADWTTNQLLQRFSQHAANISIAVDLDLFKPNRTSDYDPYRILACSRKSQHLKGFEVTRRAVQVITRYVPQASLVTFGMEQPSVYGLPKMHFPRPSDERVSYLYANCGVFVQTSHHEGFGLPILEAMACGAPVVTTKAEGNEEFCFNEHNCVLVDKGDSAGVMNGIIRIMKDRDFAEHLSRNAVQTAQQYNWSRVLSNLLHVFQSSVS